ncbi:MAG: hypothetical protein RLY93_12350 [Sumerlaeia bacterium]
MSLPAPFALPQFAELPVDALGDEELGALPTAASLNFALPPEVPAEVLESLGVKAPPSLLAAQAAARVAAEAALSALAAGNPAAVLPTAGQESADAYPELADLTGLSATGPKAAGSALPLVLVRGAVANVLPDMGLLAKSGGGGVLALLKALGADLPALPLGDPEAWGLPRGAGSLIALAIPGASLVLPGGLAEFGLAPSVISGAADAFGHVPLDLEGAALVDRLPDAFTEALDLPSLPPGAISLVSVDGTDRLAVAAQYLAGPDTLAGAGLLRVRRPGEPTSHLIRHGGDLMAAAEGFVSRLPDESAAGLYTAAQERAWQAAQAAREAAANPPAE